MPLCMVWSTGLSVIGCSGDARLLTRTTEESVMHTNDIGMPQAPQDGALSKHALGILWGLEYVANALERHLRECGQNSNSVVSSTPTR